MTQLAQVTQLAQEIQLAQVTQVTQMTQLAYVTQLTQVTQDDVTDPKDSTGKNDPDSSTMNQCWHFNHYQSIHHLSNYLAVTLLFGSPMSNELPVIGSFGLRKDFWDRHGANIATRKKVIYSKRLFRRHFETVRYINYSYLIEIYK